MLPMIAKIWEPSTALHETLRGQARIFAVVNFSFSIFFPASVVLSYFWDFMAPGRVRMIQSGILCIFAWLLGRTKYFPITLRLQMWGSILSGLWRNNVVAASGNWILYIPSMMILLTNNSIVSGIGMSGWELFFFCVFNLGGTFIQMQYHNAPLNVQFSICFNVLVIYILMVGITFMTRSSEVNLYNRTRDLAQARDQAMEASLLKSQFVATMSHEVRTPLNGIIGLTGFLTDSPLTEEQRHWAQNVETSARVLLSLSSNVLDFSRLEAGHLELFPLEFGLRHVVEDVVQACSQAAQATRTDLLCSVAEDVPEQILGDKARLSQILVNLVGNACKFTLDGVVEVFVTISKKRIPVDPHEVFVDFTVRDTGIGISEKDLAVHMFQPFHQLNRSTTRQYGGAGLGLHVSSQLAKLMGGDLTCQSKLGEGSTFTATVQMKRINPLAVTRPSENRRYFADLNVSLLCPKPAVYAVYAEELGRRGAVVHPITQVDDSQDNMLLIDSPNWMDLVPAIPAEKRVILIAPSDTRATLIPIEFIVVRKPVRMTQLSEAVSAALLQVSASHLRMPLVSNMSTPSTSETRSLVNSPDPALSSRNSVASMDVPVVVPHHPTLFRMPITTDSSPLVLIAEDHPVNQTVLQVMLRKLGYRAQVADDGLQAVERWSSRPPETFTAILMDIHMPNMDGRQATAAIRALEKQRGLKEIPIIAVTAAATTVDLEACMRVGMNAFVRKPVDIRSLSAALPIKIQVVDA